MTLARRSMLSLQNVERKKSRSTRLQCIGLYNTKTTSTPIILTLKKMDTIIMILCNITMMGMTLLRKKKSFIHMIMAIKVPKRERAIREIDHTYLRDKILSILVARQTNLTLASLKSKYKMRSSMKRTMMKTQSKKKKIRLVWQPLSPMIVFGVKINKKRK